MGFDIGAWRDYGVAMVGAADALTGLLFVAVSVNSAWFSSSASHRGRAGQALVLFAVPPVTGMPLGTVKWLAAPPLRGISDSALSSARASATRAKR